MDFGQDAYEKLLTSKEDAIEFTCQLNSIEHEELIDFYKRLNEKLKWVPQANPKPVSD